MIVTVFNNDDSKPNKYSFTGSVVHLGRNPSSEESVAVQQQSISRNHLKARAINGGIEIMDLNSSNGTFVAGEQLQPNVWTSVNINDKIKVAQFEGYITFEIREKTIQSALPPPKNKKVKRSSSSSSSERSRSREKEKKIKELPFKISESTLKMLKDMTVNRKSKEERVKFLKLMGIGKAAEYWDDIEELLKSKKGIKDGKKMTEELERQFGLARSGIEKRGLGK